MRRFSLLLALAAHACARSDLPHFEPDGRRGEPTRLVADARAAHEHALREERIEVPFGQRESGTRLVLALMNLARARGAMWVSDLEFLQVLRWKGELIECSTRIAPAAAAPPAPPVPAAPAAAPVSDDGDAPPTYTTSVSAPRPERVTVTLGEDIVRCEQHGQHYIVENEPIYPDANDVEVPHLIGGAMPVERWAMHIAWSTHCHMEHVVHEVSRWDFQVKLEWTPPDWALIGKEWTDEPLADAPPRCYRTSVKEIGEPPRHRMRARLYYRSNYKDSGRMPLPPTAGAFGN
jgi:hypothetical protein